MQKEEIWNNIIEIWKPLFTSIVATLIYSFDLLIFIRTTPELLLHSTT